MANINSMQRVEIFPSNRSSNNNTWSYRNGNPTLIFNFGVQDRYLLSDTLRLNCTVVVKTAAGGYPNNDRQAGVEAADPAEIEVRQNDKIGYSSVFQSITLSNALNQNLEYVRSFPRLLASVIPARANFEDYATILQQQFGATSNKEANGMINNRQFEVSQPILCGMFLQGEAIPLGKNGTGGLQIKLQLAPSIEANFGANGAGTYYEIYNPSLTCGMGVPPGGVLPKISAYPYLNYQSFYNVLNTSDETHNLQMGLSSVLNVFSNFVPTVWIANSTQDGNQTPNLQNGATIAGGAPKDAPISRYTALRGGLKYPYQFTVDERRLITRSAAGVEEANFQSQLCRNFLSAISSPIKDLTQTLTGNISEKTTAAGATPPVADQHYNSQGENVIGLGIRYDQMGIGDGANFKNRTFSHRIQSSLNGVSPNSIYTFALAKNMISFNDMGGIAVAN